MQVHESDTSWSLSVVLYCYVINLQDLFSANSLHKQLYKMKADSAVTIQFNTGVIGFEWAKKSFLVSGNVSCCHSWVMAITFIKSVLTHTCKAKEERPVVMWSVQNSAVNLWCLYAVCKIIKQESIWPNHHFYSYCLTPSCINLNMILTLHMWACIQAIVKISSFLNSQRWRNFAVYHVTVV